MGKFYDDFGELLQGCSWPGDRLNRGWSGRVWAAHGLLLREGANPRLDLAYSGPQSGSPEVYGL